MGSLRHRRDQGDSFTAPWAATCWVDPLLCCPRPMRLQTGPSCPCTWATQCASWHPAPNILGGCTPGQEKRHVCTPSLLAGASALASQHLPGVFERESGSESTFVGSWATLVTLGPIAPSPFSHGSGAQCIRMWFHDVGSSKVSLEYLSGVHKKNGVRPL